MLIRRLFLLSCVLRTALTFHIDEGCEARAEWRQEISWPEFQIGAWSSSDNSEIIDMRMKLKGEDEDLYSDNIKLFENKYEFLKIKFLEPETQSNNFSVVMKKGWNKFLFRIDDDYKMWYVEENENQLLLEHKVEQKLESLVIKGSNITLNCPSELRMWRISGNTILVPMDDSEEHQLSFYSDEDLKPSIKLGSREYLLRWDGQTITTLDKEPLPPFQLHNITIQCSSSITTKCIVQTTKDNKQLEDIPLSMLPEHISIQKKEGNPFFVLLQGNDQHTSASNIDSTTPNPEASVGKGATSWPAVAWIFIILTIGLLAFSAYLLYRLKQKKRPSYKNIEEAGEKEEDMPLLSCHMNSSTGSKDEPLLDAVRQDNSHHVESLLKKMEKGNLDVYAKAYIEAHLLCRRDVIQRFDSTQIKESESQKPLDRETTIRNVQKEYDKRVDSIFKAAQEGQYHQGVAHLLKYYELPATIRDAKGRSLLHVIASAKDSEEAPQWNPQNLRNFLQDKTCYTNAVDFEGKTCLHLLAEAVTNPNTPIIWDKREEMKSESAWVEIATILVQSGCDPRIKDRNGQLPQEQAKTKRSLQLCEYLEKECEKLKSTNNEVAKFDDLLKYAQEGDANSLKDLMNSHRELLPLEAIKNPLTKSATRGHLEATLLLLSGGAWICGRALYTITPLEAVHAVKSLPALFPAIMRRECINRLRFESEGIGYENRKNLRDHVDNLIRNVEHGILPSISNQPDELDDNRSKDVRALLCNAAGLGMSLTCQMLGLENVNLQPYPKEHKPMLKAINNGQIEVIYVLYRDLQMSPFTHTDIQKLPDLFLEEVWNNEFQQLQRFYSKKEHSDPHEECLETIKAAKNGLERIHVNKSVLSLISKLGLVYIFHTIKNKMVKFDINAPVDDITGNTMLHIAAMYGRFSFIEHLLYDNSLKIMVTSKGGFTATHLAAIKGNKDCMSYLKYYMTEDYGMPDQVSEGGQTASQLLQGYENLVKDSKIIFVPDEMGLEVWSIPSLEEKTRILLEKKSKQYHFSEEKSFLNFVKDFRATENPFGKCILEEMKGLLTSVSKTDDRFQGEVVVCHSNADGLNIPVESMQIYWEVKSEIFKNFKIKPNNKGEISPIQLTFESQELGKTFTDYFYEAVKKNSENFSFKSSLTWLLYPSIKRESIGVTLLLVIYENGKSRLVSVFLIPVLKTEYPEENKKCIGHLIKDMEPVVYLANLDDQWTMVTVRMEDEIINRLKEDQKLVLSGMKILTRILYSCWWFPQFENRRHFRTWQSYAFGLRTLPDRVLTSLFLEEVSSTKDEDWGQTKFLERVIATFRRATLDSYGKPHPDEKFTLFLDHQHSTFKVNFLVHSIIQFLENLKRER